MFKPTKADLLIMAKKKIKTGDNVRLKSGGPQMTVVGFTKKDQPECCWFDNDKKERRTQFPETALIVTPIAELSDEQLRAIVQHGLLPKENKVTRSKNRIKNH